MKTIALLSLLAEPPLPGPVNRTFRGESVIAWTLRRLARVDEISQCVLLAWDDQIAALQYIAAGVHACGPRRCVARIEAIAAAQRWCDGWRGGLLQSTPFDIGFSAEPARQAVMEAEADACVLIDASAALVDPAIIRSLIHAAAPGTREFYFTSAAPGLGGALLKRSLLDRLAHDHSHAGRLVHYLPEAPMLDPLTSDACVSVPLAVCRTTRRFTLDSARQIELIEHATLPLNGTLAASEAETLVRRVEATPDASSFPREITLELTTRRATKPIYSAASHLSIDRPDMTPEQFARIIAQVRAYDDVRLTLGGVGDPLLHPQIIDFLGRLDGVHSVHIETDLIEVNDALLRAIVDCGIDVITVALPAATPATYEKVMGVDAMAKALENVRRLLIYRQQCDRGVPVIVPRFVKLNANFAEMETWHDTWLRAVGSAVIGGPSTFGGRVSKLGVADMTPPLRKPCARVAQRMTILSDGTIASCEEDVTGQQAMGHIDHDTIAGVWQKQFGALQERHENLTGLPMLCGNCREWHRP